MPCLTVRIVILGTMAILLLAVLGCPAPTEQWYILTYSAYSNGTISGTTSQTVYVGASGTAVTAVANTDYHFTQWSDGATQNPRTDTNVTANISVAASFAPNMVQNSIAIGTIEDLQKIGNDPSYPADGRQNYILTQDIDASVTSTWNNGAGFLPISDGTYPFMGSFNGQFHVISNLFIKSDPSTGAKTGLFAAVDGRFGGVISNVLLEESDISGAVAGGLVGENEGTITQCFSTGVITADDGSGKYAGGLIGNNAGYVTDCCASGDVTVDAWYALAGGLIGLNSGSVKNCYSTSSIWRCGYLSIAGGLIGGDNGGTVTSSYWNKEKSVYDCSGVPAYLTNSGGGAGETGEAMCMHATFVGWDFTNVWEIGGVGNYPFFVGYAGEDKETLTYYAAENGTILGISPQTVTYGGSGTAVTAVANTDYHFTQWSDGSTQNPRTDTNVTENITVMAAFAINQYTLTYTTGVGGAIMGISPQTVYARHSGTAVTAVPTTGYCFAHWSDGSTQNPRTDTNVTANISVTANFSQTTTQYTLTYSAGGSGNAEGSILGTSPQTVISGGNGTAVTAIPNSGYSFVQWSDGSTQNPRTDTSVTADLWVRAYFVENGRFLLVYTAGAGGSISGQALQSVAANGYGMAVTAVPNQGYHFTAWVGFGIPCVTTATRQDVNVTDNLSATAYFVQNGQ